MESDHTFLVEVCFIAHDRQFLRALKVPEGTTIQQALWLSGLTNEFPDIDFNLLKTGIYSRIKAPDTVLKERDRVEVYRPLEVDPMVARRRRVLKKHS